MKPRLLLHCCCAPCSSAILEHLSNHYDITLYFFNPNITNEKEYKQRADEVVRLVAEMKLSNVEVVIEDFYPAEFYSLAMGLENSPECGSRCKACYTRRLQKTAGYAVENGFQEFSTTLTISPYKPSHIINDIGIKIAQWHNLTYLCFDFGFLYTRSLELCEEYGLYQQDYCGCEYSKH